MFALENLGKSLRGWVRRAAPNPIGVEVATEKLHMVQLAGDEYPPVIAAAVSLPYEGGRNALLANRARLKGLVERARATRPFRGSVAVSCLPQSDLKIIALAYRKTAGQSDEAAIIGELRSRLQEELDDTVVDYIKVRNEDSDAAEHNAVVAVARRAGVLAYLEALHGAGLEVTALDIGPAALTRLVAAMGQGVSYSNALLINFGGQRSYLSLIWGRRLMLDRELDFGEERLVARLAKTLDMTEALATELLYRDGFDGSGPNSGPEGAEIGRTAAEVLRPEFASLAGEAAQTLIYAASKTRGQSVERIYLMGSVARYPGVAGLLQTLVSMPVEVLNPFTVFTARPDASVLAELDPIAGIGVATGLALRGTPRDG